MKECEACNGCGEECATCHELPDNCDCESRFVSLECEECQGSGEVEADDEEEAES